MKEVPSLAPSNPLGIAPPRRAGSLRRTTSMDMSWPNGWPEPLILEGVARDIFSADAKSPPTILAEHRMEARVNRAFLIEHLAAQPHKSGLEALVGAPAISGFRRRLQEVMPDEAAAGSALYTLLDDIAGCSLISGWVFTRWPEGNPAMQKLMSSDDYLPMEGTCTGFRPGSSALQRGPRVYRGTVVPPLPNPADPDGLHPLSSPQGMAMRRVRRIDIWIDDGMLHIDAMFQDSASTPTGGREAVHEYGLTATADAVSGVVRDIQADPRVLPYPECPAAAANVHRMIGTPLREMRARVLDELRRTEGCTHLNDALRALAEVPGLLLGQNQALLMTP